MSINIFQLHKPEASSFVEIQDRYKISKDCNVIALADGTTQGHKSELWAQYLVNEFVKIPVFGSGSFTEFINKTSNKYNKISKPADDDKSTKSVEWLMKQKEEEGSSATFIAISFNNNNYEAISYGDSKMFLIRDGKLKTNLPEDDKNAFINTDFIKFDPENIRRTKGDINKGDNILIVSDSLGDFIKKDSNNSKRIMSLSSFQNFRKLVESSFENNSMEMDDISLINIHIDSSNNVVEHFPEKNFKYKKTLLPAPKPKIITKTLHTAKGEEEMKQLIEMLQSANDDFTKEIGDYKLMTSQLIKMNFVQWIIIALIILYSASSVISSSFSNIKEKVFPAKEMVIKQDRPRKETAQVLTEGNNALPHFLKKLGAPIDKNYMSTLWGKYSNSSEKYTGTVKQNKLLIKALMESEFKYTETQDNLLKIK